MTIFRESYLYVLLMTLYRTYETSGLHRLLVRLGAWCNGQIEGSAILRPLCREGAVARAWQDSLACRILTALVNLPGWLLHQLYRALHTLFDGSVFSRLAFSMGQSTAIAQSWVILLLWVIPFERWNNAYSMMGFVLLLALFYLGSMRREDFRLDIRTVGFYPVLFFGAVFLAVVFSCERTSSARFFLYHCTAALCVLLTVSAVRCTNDLKRLAAGGGTAVLIASLYAVVQRIQGVEVNESYVDMTLNEGMPGRVYSFFDNPNTFAEVLVLLLPLVIALLLSSRHTLSRLIAAGVTVVGAAALGMTYSRASWVGLACALAVMVFLWKPKLIPAFAVVCVLCIPLLPATIWNRLLTIANPKDTSTASRIPLYQAALRVIGEDPVTGAGLGTAAVQKFISDHNFYHARAPFVHAHNFYLQVWIETGLLGIIGFVGGMLWNIKNAARTVRHCSDSAARTITCAAASALCGAMVAGLADYFWNYPRVMCIFWFVFALALAGTKLCRESAEERAEEEAEKA